MGVAGTDKHLGMESISAKVVGEGGLGLIVGRILYKFPLIVSHLSFLRWEFFTDISERLREHESHTLFTFHSRSSGLLPTSVNLCDGEIQLTHQSTYLCMAPGKGKHVLLIQAGPGPG